MSMATSSMLVGVLLKFPCKIQTVLIYLVRFVLGKIL